MALDKPGLMGIGRAMCYDMPGPEPAQPIGVFDSGVGGLTVLRALTARLPGEDFLYLGDTARLPYGAKSPASVSRYAVQCARVLADQGVKLLVVACNTASSVALPALRENFPGLPVLGVVEPGARAACERTDTGRIAVIATESTVRGGAYHTAIRRIRPNAQIHSLPCPLFVALAEEGWTDGPLVEGIVQEYLRPLFARFGEQGPDTLVLGCTHFPVLCAPIARVAGSGVAVIDSAATAAAQVAEYLDQAGLRRGKQANAEERVRFMATDGAGRFARVAGVFLGQDLTPEQITIVDL